MLFADLLSLHLVTFLMFFLFLFEDYIIANSGSLIVKWARPSNLPKRCSIDQLTWLQGPLYVLELDAKCVTSNQIAAVTYETSNGQCNHCVCCSPVQQPNIQNYNVLSSTYYKNKYVNLLSRRKHTEVDEIAWANTLNITTATAVNKFMESVLQLDY